jgi:hypothetical protein
MNLFCINDGVPELTVSLLRDACAGRGVSFHEIDAPSFPFDPDAGLAAGDMLYRPAVSAVAARVEQFVWRDGVASFHADPLGPFFGAFAYPLLFRHAGLPTPRTLPVVSGHRERLKAAVAAVGGFPALIKVMGFEGGVGAIRVDALPALYSTMDFLLASGQQPFLCAFIDEAVHWRATVVGDRVVAAYRNTPIGDDFRTFGSEDPADFTETPDPALADLAVRATKALRVELAGVDILQHPSGRLYLLEANFPCYFAHAQEVAGIDVAGAMVEHLVGKARGMLAG